MTLTSYPRTKRLLCVIGSYFLAVLVADLVTISPFAISMPALGLPLFMKGLIYILVFASAPALAFIGICEIVGPPSKWVYILAGSIVAMLAHATCFYAELKAFPAEIAGVFVVTSVFGGGAGAFVFWAVAVAPLKSHVSKQLSKQMF